MEEKHVNEYSSRNKIKYFSTSYRTALVQNLPRYVMPKVLNSSNK